MGEASSTNLCTARNTLRCCARRAARPLSLRPSMVSAGVALGMERHCRAAVISAASGALQSPRQIIWHVGQIAGISSPSQELSPCRKIRCGLFESDNTLSGNILPSAGPSRRSERNWLTAKADPADRRAPGEDDGQAEPESTFPRHCASPAFKHLKPTQPSPRGRGHITGSPEGVRKYL